MIDVFNMLGKLGLDTSEYKKGMQDAKEEATSLGDVFKGSLAADVVSKGFSAIVDGAKKGAAGMVDLTKQIVRGYGQTEQLVGGVEKLYGDSAATIEQYANDAYKTSGMSANKYMDTATQFSAALISSLGGDTAKAADQTDVAMRAMSDNVNVFGSNVEDVTNAFKGFSKQNYTMLDNLKLGYGGTKSEMERLISDANEYAASIGQASDLSIDSFSDIVTAIELIQEKQGIAGTTAKEAATTLDGSINMMKMAWQNLVDGLADPNADIGVLINNMVDSAEGALKNLVPVIERAIQGFGKFVTDVAPIIISELPGLINDLVPPILTTIGAMIQAIVAALPGILTALNDALPGIIQIITDAIPEILPPLIEAVGTLIDGLAQALPEVIDSIIDVLPELAKSIWDGISTAFENASPAGKVVIAGIVAKFVGGGILDGVNKAGKVAKAAKGTFSKIIAMISPSGENGSGGIFDNATKSAGPLLTVITKIGGAFSKLGGVITGTVLPAIGSFIASPVGLIILGIVAAITAVILIIKNWGAISEWFQGVWETVIGAVQTVIAGFQEFFSGVADFFSGLFATMEAGVQAFGDFLTTIWTGIVTALTTIWDGIVEVATTVWTAITDTIMTIWNGFYSVFGPLIEALGYLFETIFEAIGIIVSDVMTAISDMIMTVWNAIVAFLTPILEGIEAVFEIIWNGILTVITTVWDAIVSVTTAVWDTISGALSTVWNAIASVATSVFSAIRDFLAGIWDAVSGTVMSVWNAISGFLGGIWNGIKDTVSSVFGAIREFISNIWDTIRDKTIGIWDTIRDGIASKVGAVLDTVQNLFGSMKDAVLNVASDAWNWGKEIIQNIIDGIRSKIADLAGAITGVADKIREKLHFSEPDVGPLKDFNTWMPDMMKGLSKGITSNTWRLEDASTAAAQAIQDGMDVSNMSFGTTGTGSGNANTSAPSFGAVTINVYGAQGQDVNQLADIVAERLNNAVRRERAVFA